MRLRACILRPILALLICASCSRSPALGTREIPVTSARWPPWVNASLAQCADRSWESAEEIELSISEGASPAVDLRTTASGARLPFDHITLTSRNGYQFGTLGDSGTARFVMVGTKVTGIVDIGTARYEVFPLSNGHHALVRLKRWPHVPVHPRLRVLKPAVNLPTTKAAPQPAVIDILVEYTTAAAKARPDIVGLIQLAVADLNEASAATGVKTRYQLRGPFLENELQSADMESDLIWFRDAGDGHFDAVTRNRKDTRADIAVLFIDGGGSAHGQSAAYGATIDTAFAVVDPCYAATYHSFAHEIGHLSGLRHQPGDDSDEEPYRQGHGYASPPDGSDCWMTIMSVDDGRDCERIQFWSNLTQPYKGVQPMGIAGLSDAATVIDITADTISRFGDQL